MSGRVRSWAAVAVSAAVLIACGPADAPRGAAVSGAGTGPGAAPTTTTTTSPPEGVDVRIERSRLFETRGQLNLLIANHGPDALGMETIQLRSPLFEAVTPDRRATELPPTGRTVSMPISFGAPRCGAPDGGGGAGHDVVVATRGGARSLPAELHPRVHALWRTACATVDVARAAHIGFAEDWTIVDDVTMEGNLEVRLRQPGRVVEVDQLAGSVIFTLDALAPASPLGRVDDDRPTIGIPVSVRAGRCDPHALVESKRTYVFVVFLRLDGDDITVTVEPEVARRAPFDQLLEPCVR